MLTATLRALQRNLIWYRVPYTPENPKRCVLRPHLVRQEAVRHVARRQGDRRLQRPWLVHALVVPLVPLLQPLCRAQQWTSERQVQGSRLHTQRISGVSPVSNPESGPGYLPRGAWSLATCSLKTHTSVVNGGMVRDWRREAPSRASGIQINRAVWRQGAPPGWRGPEPGRAPPPAPAGSAAPAPRRARCASGTHLRPEWGDCSNYMHTQAMYYQQGSTGAASATGASSGVPPSPIIFLLQCTCIIGPMHLNGSKHLKGPREQWATERPKAQRVRSEALKPVHPQARVPAREAGYLAWWRRCTAGRRARGPA